MNPQDVRDAEHACTHTLYRFYSKIDAGDFDAVAQLMAPEGVWHRQGEQLKGPNGALVALGKRDPRIVSAHLVCNPVVDVLEPGLAEITALVLVLRHVQQQGGPAVPLVPPPRAVLRCNDRLVRTEQGWRFLVKRSTSVFRSDG
jgi:hypothetical protein